MPAIIDTYMISGLSSLIPIAVPTMRTRRPRMKYAGEFFFPTFTSTESSIDDDDDDDADKLRFAP